MNLKEWYAAAQHVGIVYAINKPNKTNTSAKIMLYTIISVNGGEGPRLMRAWPNENGQYSESLAKKIGFRLSVNVSEPHYFVKADGVSRVELVLNNIWNGLYPNEKRPNIAWQLLTSW